MLQQLLVFHSLNNISLNDIPHFVYSFIDGQFGCFHLLAIANRTALDIHVPYSIPVFSLGEYIAGSDGNPIINFLKNYQNVFHCG